MGVPAKVTIQAGVTTGHLISPNVLGAVRNHVYDNPAGQSAQSFSWAQQRAGVMAAMDSIKANWGKSHPYGAKGLVYRPLHGTADGRYGNPNGIAGHHIEETWNKLGPYPYDDVKIAMNEAEDMGAEVIWAANFGSSYGVSETATLAAYMNHPDAAVGKRNVSNASHGPYGVKFWEIGNEVSLGTQKGYNDRSTSPMMYSKAAKLHAKAIRDNSPGMDVKIGFVAGTGLEPRGDNSRVAPADPQFPDAQTTWWRSNDTDPYYAVRDLFRGCRTDDGRQQIDALVYHGYTKGPIANSFTDAQITFQSRLSGFEWARQITHPRVMTAINDWADNPGAIELWNTEYFDHYYNAKSQGLFAAMYGTEGQMYAMRANHPFAIPFCMWHKTGGATENIGDNVFFVQANTAKPTPWLRWMQVWAKAWGDRFIPTVEDVMPRYTTYSIQNGTNGDGSPRYYNICGTTNIQVAKVNVLASKSLDGSKLYVMVLNRTNGETPIDLELDVSGMAVAPNVEVATLEGSNGWDSTPEQTAITYTTWRRDVSGPVIESRSATLMHLTFYLDGTAPPPPPPPPTQGAIVVPSLVKPVTRQIARVVAAPLVDPLTKGD